MWGREGGTKAQVSVSFLIFARGSIYGPVLENEPHSSDPDHQLQVAESQICASSWNLHPAQPPTPLISKEAGASVHSLHPLWSGAAISSLIYQTGVN